MRQLIYLPSMSGINLTRGHRKRQGRGMGSVLLGGVGSASSYEGYDDYLETTNKKMGSGLGLGVGIDRSGLNRKLESLNVSQKKQKVKNIRFNL